MTRKNLNLNLIKDNVVDVLFVLLTAVKKMYATNALNSNDKIPIIN